MVTLNYKKLAYEIKEWGKDLGFQQVGMSRGYLESDKAHLRDWLEQGMCGEMEYMRRNIDKRANPEQLVPNTYTIISARMDYYPNDAESPDNVLANPELAYISRYALGRDYHKFIRRRLQKLCNRLQDKIGDFGYRCFSDSAPVLEKALARNAGLGWIGKHSNLIHPEVGSWFFLGEIYTDLPLEEDTSHQQTHCGTCTACIDICPTKAILAPQRVDARRCISYLTIEFKGIIPVEFRKAIGNRIYGCDDCQLVCPWNRFAQPTLERDFQVRYGLDKCSLFELFKWSKEMFYRRMEGSAIRRIGYESWRRNIAVALGNIPKSDKVATLIRQSLTPASDLVREHLYWALVQHEARFPAAGKNDSQAIAKD